MANKQNVQARITGVTSKLVSFTTNFKSTKYALNATSSSIAPLLQDSIVDVSRLAKVDAARVQNFLKTDKVGRLFASRQKTLQFQNPKMQVGLNFNTVNNTGRTFLGGIINNIVSGGAIEQTRIYNDNKSLLLQIANQGSGYHFNRAGNQPITPYQATYQYVVKNKPASENRLVILKDLKITDIERNRGVSNLDSITLSSINDLGLSRRVNILLDYPGGPGSGDANRNTIIQRYDYTNTWINFSRTNKIRYNGKGSSVWSLQSRVTTLTEGQTITRPRLPAGYVEPIYERPENAVVTGSLDTSLSHRIYTTSSFVDNTAVAVINRSRTLTYADLMKKKKDDDIENVGILQDFRTGISGEPSTTGYEGIGNAGYRDTKYGTGNPGSKNISRVNYSAVGVQGNDQGVDKINALDIGETPTDGTRDMIKCSIIAMETQQNSSTVEVPLVFRAFVTEFADNYNTDYAAHTYVGRGEEFYTYNKTTRKVNFSLTIAAQSRAEMMPLYRKLNYLVSQMYPGYSGFDGGKGNGFVRAPLVKLNIGDYLADQPGFINSMNISIPQGGTWEIAADKEKDVSMYQLPHALKLTIAFTPIHNFLARRSHKGVLGSVITPFITPNEKGANKQLVNGKKVIGLNNFNIG